MNKIHQWIKKCWKSGYEVMAHCYYDQLNDDHVDFYIKKTKNELGLGKTKKTAEQKENYFNMRDFLRVKYPS